MKHEITLCRVPRLLPEGRKGSLALWEGCTRWFRAVLWGPHPALRATFPSWARLFCAFVLLTRPLGQSSWSKGIAHPADRNGVELRSSTEKSGSNAFRKVGSTGGKHAPRRSSGRAASRLFKISNLLQILKSSTPKTPARGVFSAQDDTRGALACPTESSFKGSQNVKKGCLRISSLFCMMYLLALRSLRVCSLVSVQLRIAGIGKIFGLGEIYTHHLLIAFIINVGYHD